MASTRPETSRSAQLLVPYLSMPLVIGSLWIALAPHGLVALAVLTAGSAALACYMLGAVIAGLQVSRDLALRRAVARAFRTWRMPGLMAAMRRAAMLRPAGWDEAGREYLALYERAAPLAEAA